MFVLRVSPQIKSTLGYKNIENKHFNLSYIQDKAMADKPLHLQKNICLPDLSGKNISKERESERTEELDGIVAMARRLPWVFKSFFLHTLCFSPGHCAPQRIGPKYEFRGHVAWYYK